MAYFLCSSYVRNSLCRPSPLHIQTNVKEAVDLLTQDQVDELATYFKMFDKESKGFIPVSQVGPALRAMGQTYEETDLEKLIKGPDSDDESGSEYNAEIDFQEFLAMVSRIIMHELDEEDTFIDEMKEAFRLYDKEENGYINISDLRDILRALDESTTEEELDELIADIDTDSSGTIDFDDFMELMTSRRNEDDEDDDQDDDDEEKDEEEAGEP